MTGRQDIFQQAMNQGHSAAWDQLWDRAAAYYRQALEEFPDHPQALTNLGLALYEMQEYEQALLCYQRAAMASPNDPLPFVKVAQLAERLGNLDMASKASLRAAELYLQIREVNKALENWKRVTRLDPENLQAHSRLAMVNERIGEKQQAVSEYLAIASLLQNRGDLENAVRSVNQALKIVPNHPDGIQALKLLRDQKPLPKPQRPRGGTAPLRMAQVRQMEPPRKITAKLESRLDPVAQARQRALTQLAGMLFDSPDEEPVDSAPRLGLSSLMRGASGPSRQMDRTRVMLHLSQVVDLQTRENYRQATEELERATQAGLDHPAAYFDLGFLYGQIGRYEDAIRTLQQVCKHADFELGARLLLGELHRKDGQLREAATEYLEALKIADGMVVESDQADDLRQLYEPLIEAQGQLNDEQVQERVCENVSGLLMRMDWRDHLTRARQQLPNQADGRPPIPLAEILTEARSSQVVDSINKIYELAEQGKLRSAMEEAFYALQQAPTYLPLHTFMAELLVKEDLLQEAAAKFMMAARTYSMRGEAHRAIDLYRRILELAPMDLNARTRLIEQLVSRGQEEEAIGQYLELGEVYYNQADLDMARKTYTEALRLAQQSKVDRSWRVKVLHRMADIDLQSLDWRQALRIFEQVRTLQPDDEKSRTNLVELNFRLGQETQALAELDSFIAYLISAGKKERAIEFLENLVKEEPERISVRRRLAEAYRQAGRIQEAIENLDAIGETQLQAGERKNAIQTIENILSLDPPNKTDYLRLLKQLREMS